NFGHEHLGGGCADVDLASRGRDGRDFKRMFRVVASRWRFRFGRWIDDRVLESMRHGFYCLVFGAPYGAVVDYRCVLACLKAERK
ncbi:hypothetical protein THAOC_31389, partial [Thalassiosira oceanica]